MTAFDTDVLSDVFRGVPAVLARWVTVPTADQFVPVVAAEEVFRGRLDAIRRAQAGKGPLSLEQAYGFLEQTIVGLGGMRLLSYDATAHSIYVGLKSAKVRIGTRDLRIAAICLAHGAKLVTRNARDYGQVPGLNLEVWT